MERGRPKLSEEKKQEIMVLLIRITHELILRDGIQTVTIRRIAQEAGVNSAILYKYFTDLDELIMFACVDLLKAYPAELAAREASLEITSPEKAYFITWELFCKHTFKYPECMQHLFFGRHSDRLGHVITDYYELFPEQLEGISYYLQVMVRTANLSQRNLEVLRPMLTGSVSDEELLLVNDLTVAFFHSLLLEKISGGDAVDDAALISRMLAACRLLMACACPV